MKPALVLACLALTGCINRQYRLPPIQAEELSVIHTDPFGKIEASATGVKVTDTTITADSARWEISYPSWHDIVIAKGYKQRRAKEVEDKP